MKTSIKNLLTGLGLILAVHAQGQTFTTLYSFVLGNDAAGDPTGGKPSAGVILSGDTLYGTTQAYGGTVFAISTNGTGFTTLYSFTDGDGISDGIYPNGLVLSGTTLYGTTSGGGFGPGTEGSGTVFAVNTDGTDFTTLYSFTTLPR